MFKKLLQKLNSSRILALIFLLYIFYVGAAQFPGTISTLHSILSTTPTAVGTMIRSLDDSYENMLTTDQSAPLLQNKGTYINLNGLMAKILDQDFINERVKLKNGHMTELVENSPDPKLLQTAADNIASLCRRQEETGKHFLFVMTPSQISKYEDLLPTGYTDSNNKTADQLLSLLTQQNVPCLDLREVFHREGKTAEEAFFLTDHHWTAETGFWAYTKLLEDLNGRGWIPDIDSFYTDPDNFTFRTYENSFLGSSGKRSGVFYAGIDDFSVIEPNFDTAIRVQYDGSPETQEGTYSEVVNSPVSTASIENKDYFNYNFYGMYGHSDTVPVLRTNESAPLQEKLMLIGDSFTNIPFSLMSLYAASSCELDMRVFGGAFGLEYYGDFAQYYTSYDPDIVVLLINPDGCTDTNATYPFFPETPAEDP